MDSYGEGGGAPGSVVRDVVMLLFAVDFKHGNRLDVFPAVTHRNMYPRGILLRFHVLEGTYLSTRQDFFQHHFYHVVGCKCGGFCVIIVNSHDITRVIEDNLMK